MGEIASAFVSLIPSARGFGRRLDSEIGGEVDGSGRRMGSTFGKALAFGATAAVGGGLLLAGFLKGAVEEAQEAAVVGARTENVIRSMGGAAGVTAEQVADLAGSLSNKAGIDDEAIQSGQNLLLTFGNIRNEVGKGNDIFSQTSGLMVDMSVAMGQDMKSSAIQLGKALNDPIKGVSALSRVGVSFTEQQKEQIKRLTESGDALGAQKIILGEVKKQFGGAAEAMATPAQRASVAWGNFKETIGAAVLPIVNQVLTFFVDQAIPAVERFASAIGPAFASVVGGGGALMPIISSLVGYFQSLWPTVQTLAQQFVAVLLPGIQSIAATVQSQFLPAFQRLLPIITPVAKFLLQMFGEAVIGVIRGFIDVIKGVVTAVSGVVNLVVALIRGDWAAAWAAMKQIVSGVITAIFGALKVWWYGSVLALFRKAAVFLVKGIWVGMWNGLKAGAQRGWQFLNGLFAGAVNLLLKIIKGFVNTYIAFWKGLWRLVSSVASAAWRSLRNGFSALGSAIANIFRSLGASIKNAVTGALDFVVNAVKAIPGRIMALGGAFLNAGRSIIGKLVDGMKNASGVVSGIAGNVWNAVRGMLNSAISKINAALSFTINLPGPDISVNPPNIPYLAAGGIVSRPTLAMIGEGREREAVLPLSKLQALIDSPSEGAAAARYNIEKIVVRDEREAFRQMEMLNRRAAILASMA